MYYEMNQFLPFSIGEPEKKHYSEDVSVNGRKILHRIFKKWEKIMWSRLM
jgi:hypothetical protein